MAFLPSNLVIIFDAGSYSTSGKSKVCPVLRNARSKHDVGAMEGTEEEDGMKLTDGDIVAEMTFVLTNGGGGDDDDITPKATAAATATKTTISIRILVRRCFHHGNKGVAHTSTTTGLLSDLSSTKNASVMCGIDESSPIALVISSACSSGSML
mmetsp:Transcript_10118/g.21900  ORF Transcript_10118/g.21900 Transcript_10118/m.21900 type:complete len:154 (-) Transcript_10118:681-1142(-)